MQIRNSIIPLVKGSSSDRGYNYEAKLSCENFFGQLTIRECMGSSFEGSVNMDLYEDVGEDKYLRKEVACSQTKVNG